MSGDSTPNSGQLIGSDNLGEDFHHDTFIGSVLSALAPPDAPKLQGPNAKSSTPTTAQASTTALQNQIAQEKNARASMTNTTTGAGLMDEPTTTSRVLLGA